MRVEAQLSRRTALKLLAGQMALLASGCSRPREEIVPYVRMPERLVPGVPLQFATTLDLGGFGRGVLCTSIEGRPIKVEGNPQHPASLGATDPFAEAAVLSLYDPDRSQAVRTAGEISNWAAFLDTLKPRLEDLAARNGDGLRILTGPISSPTLLRQIDELRRRLPKLQWHVHDPLEDSAAHQGSLLAFGRLAISAPRLGEVDVIVSLDADPLGPGPMQIVNARGFSDRRRVRSDGADIGRLYAIESSPTLTGANADHRLALPPARIADFAVAIARGLGADLPEIALPTATAAFQQEVSRDIAAHRGRALVVVGPTLPPDIHALCHWINAQLQAPIDYWEPDDEAAGAPLADLVRDLDAGAVDSLFVLQCNPAYDAPPALGFARAAAKARLSVHLGCYFDETAALCQWHIPATHGLEGWSDLATRGGAASLVQPLIEPLYATRSSHEVVDALAGGVASGYALVRETWAAAAPAGGFETWWRQALQDGIIVRNRDQKAADLTPSLPQLKTVAAGSPLTLILRPDPCIYDGSFANNAWLQELPKPLTKEVWGNSIGLAPADAATLGVIGGDALRLTANGGSVSAPVRIAAGHAPGVLSLYLGHGRTAAGVIGTGVGANAYLLRADASFAIDRVTAEPTGERASVPSTQHQFSLEGEAEDLFPSYALDQFRRLDANAKTGEPASFFAPPPGSGARWGMVIDTSLCIGCNACVVACQVENNSPVVGPDEIARGRDMHWLRIDAYEIGTSDNPRTGFQPVPCMHCETAPCEPVCPTGASVHDSEGLNVQVYNRCIGTRFCEANCPYKVRRFNYFGYADGQEYADLGADVMRAHNNPDVTVRSRGVMEKCTYCVQRISRARRAADKDNRAIADGEVVTACQAACPAKAINFGDLSLKGAQVSTLAREPHHYSLLGHLDTRPRTTYLAQVRDPNPTLVRRPG
jgi:molybdopterin-containing oxidoreductase family iron-sulfur binding subunit